MPISTIDSKGLTSPLTSGVTTNTVTSASATALTLQSAGTTAVTIDTSQNVGIGTATPSSFYSEARNLVVGTGTGGQGISIYAGSASQSRLMFANGTAGSQAYNGFVQYDHSSNTLQFGTNGGSERMRIDSSGSLCIGNSGNFGAKVNITFDPASTNGLLFAVSSGTFTNNYIYFQNSGGSKIGSVSSNNSSVTYNTTSDYRIKTNVQPMVGALNNVMQLNPVTYDWKPEFAEGRSQGFIAHELQAVVPDAVTGEKDAVDADGNPVYQGIDTSFLVATLTAAIQELKALVDAQATEIAELKAKVA